ncbi:hypothetical protein CEP54_005271 [Fusarium duplospermum]|uniref:Apple domain-containing protein n=1 Tax=Fusarium duplospermum TaxID=1325734 RepID=A0A428QD28_9HYPO|nr:hypothetical protein CEP54_005271 [Fusarium duplospermum]
MKSSVIYSLLAIAARGTSAACVEGHRETMAPGYTVEYKCDIYRTGDTHDNIASESDCALLCQTNSRPVCSYHAVSRRCIVGKEDGKDTSRVGVSYMFKVEEPEEDPFAEDEDPFSMDCEEEKTACLSNEQVLKDELAKCKAASSSSGSGRCDIRKTAKGSIGYYTTTHPGCKQKCEENPKCKAFTYYVCNRICNLFDKAVQDLETSDSITHIMSDKDCA